MTKRRIELTKIILFALFLALGWLLPLLTGQIPEIGSMLLPMHIPVIIAGFVLGPYYGLLLGFVTPLTRSLLFGMPPIYPTSFAMAFELATYGFVSGFLYNLFARKLKLNQIFSTYLSLIIAMLLGRLVWGLVKTFIGLASSDGFTFAIFLSGAFITAWPGIVLQIVLIPLIIIILNKLKLIDKYLLVADKKESISNKENQKD